MCCTNGLIMLVQHYRQTQHFIISLNISLTPHAHSSVKLWGTNTDGSMNEIKKKKKTNQCACACQWWWKFLLRSLIERFHVISSYEITMIDDDKNSNFTKMTTQRNEWKANEIKTFLRNIFAWNLDMEFRWSLGDFLIGFGTMKRIVRCPLYASCVCVDLTFNMENWLEFFGRIEFAFMFVQFPKCNW